MADRVTNINNKRRIAFIYTSPPIRKLTNMFKGTNIQITFKPVNTISRYFTENKLPQNNLHCSGIYEISYQTC